MVHLRSYLPPKKYKRALLLKWTSVQSSISFLFWHQLNLSFTLFTLLSLQSIWFFFLFFPIFLFSLFNFFSFQTTQKYYRDPKVLHKSTTGNVAACLTSVINRKDILNYSSECRIEKIWHINGEDVYHDRSWYTKKLYVMNFPIVKFRSNYSVRSTTNCWR